MSKVKEIMVAAILPAIKEVGKIEMKQVFSGIKDHYTPEMYRNTLRGLHSNFLLLRQVSVKTKTKVDDGIIDIIIEAVKESADSDGIVLL